MNHESYPTAFYSRGWFPMPGHRLSPGACIERGRHKGPAPARGLPQQLRVQPKRGVGWDNAPRQSHVHAGSGTLNPPCNGCRFWGLCAAQELACEGFLLWVARDPQKAADPALFLPAREFFAAMSVETRSDAGRPIDSGISERRRLYAAGRASRGTAA